MVTKEGGRQEADPESMRRPLYTAPRGWGRVHHGGAIVLVGEEVVLEPNELPQRRSIQSVDGTMPGQRHQWWESTLERDEKGQKPHCRHSRDGRPNAAA